MAGPVAGVLRELLGSRSASPLERAARMVVVAILVAIGIDHVVFAIAGWPLHDMDVYLAAATRLRTGQPLYVPGDVAVDSFWYAPWYAVAWIPFSYLPRIVVAIGWSAVLLAATAAVTVMLARMGRTGPMLALLIGPPLFAVSAGGNVQALMVLSLLWGLQRRSGPFWVAVAASMKYTPILLALAYAARREWWRALAAVAVTAFLFAPGLLMGITGAGVRSEAAQSLLGISPVLYAAVIAIAAASVFFVRRRFAFLAATAAAVLALPRLFVYDVTLLSAGMPRNPSLSLGNETRTSPLVTKPGSKNR